MLSAKECIINGESFFYTKIITFMQLYIFLFFYFTYFFSSSFGEAYY